MATQSNKGGIEFTNYFAGGDEKREELLAEPACDCNCDCSCTCECECECECGCPQSMCPSCTIFRLIGWAMASASTKNTTNVAPTATNSASLATSNATSASASTSATVSLTTSAV